ncbi:uncharacterized protein LOC106637506 [Copidosoma floridanum]|uniref:uncharacterized protein LOC106637506 n=1 Tax=Copidosoma floridanum TaxID=29053 RepID=UPI0006C99A06|nr:uncharacterized protein LOC106637506 [Copidosoma floridanum]
MKGHVIYSDVSLEYVRPYVPVALRRTAFEVIHNLSHPSVQATSKAIAHKFYCPSMHKDVTLWAQQCLSCQKAKVHPHNRAVLGSLNKPTSQFDHVHLDLFKLPLCLGFQYCLTLIDCYTSWPVAISLPDRQATTVAIKAFMDGWVSHYGTPFTITTNQGVQFESALFTALSKYLGTHHIRIAPYHPQSNGLIERFHCDLKAALMYSPETPWPTSLPMVMLGLRSVFKEDLQASAVEMLYSVALRVPGEFFGTTSQPGTAPATSIESLRHLPQVLKPERSVVSPYSSPHKVVDRIDYVVDINGSQTTLSTDSLKPSFFDDPAQPNSMPAASLPSSLPVTRASEPSSQPPSSHPAIQTPSGPPAPIRSSFRLSGTNGTRKRVDVACQVSPAGKTCTRTTRSTRSTRRKQRLIPRQDF